MEGEVVTALGKTYHQKCFRCAQCDRTFPTGERVTFTGKSCLCTTCAKTTLSSPRYTQTSFSWKIRSQILKFLGQRRLLTEMRHPLLHQLATTCLTRSRRSPHHLRRDRVLRTVKLELPRHHLQVTSVQAAEKS